MDIERSEPVWAQVHALTVIATVGSFTRAAERLGLSKAAVSQRIAELERGVGATLVQRTTRSVRLTEAGRQLVEATSGSFAQILRSVGAVRDATGEPRGQLRVTAPVALGRQYIVGALVEFLRAYPEIRVDLDLSDQLVPLAREGFDLAIRHTGAPPENHIAWRLCASRSMVVASPAYLRRRGTPQHPADLREHDCLAYLRSATPAWPFERARRGAGEDVERVEVVVGGALRANNSEALRDAVLGGLGIGLLPDFSAAAALRSGRLRELLPGWRAAGFFGDAIHAIRPWSPTTPRNVRVLVEHLQTALKEGF